jgi:hypothetical protein
MGLHNLILTDLRLGLADLLELRHQALSLSLAGKSYAPALTQLRDAILALPTALLGKPLAEAPADRRSPVARRACGCADAGTRQDAGKLRMATVGLLARCRRDLAAEIARDPLLPRDLDAQVFGFIDELAGMRATATARALVPSIPPPPL